MGRFYKTEKAEFIKDKMYQPPIELMTQVLTNVGKQIDAQEAVTVGLYDKLKAEGLSADQPRLQEIISGYTSQVDELASSIAEDPLSFGKKKSELKQLARKISTDWGAQGEVGAIQNNKLASDNWLKEELEKVKKTKGYVLEQDVTNAKMMANRMFQAKGGTGFKAPGQYNQWAQEGLNAFVNVEDISEDRAKGYVADAVASSGAYSDGQTIWATNSKTEKVDRKTIVNGVQSAMINDMELNNYYDQQIRLGLMSPQEKQLRFKMAAERVADKYAFSKTESGRDRKGEDPNYTRAQNDLYDKKKEDRDLNNAMALKKYEADLKAEEDVKALTSISGLLTPDQMAADQQTFNAGLSAIAKSAGLLNGGGNTYNIGWVGDELKTKIGIAQNAGDKDSEDFLKGKLQQLKMLKGLTHRIDESVSTASAIPFIGARGVAALQKDVKEKFTDGRALLNVPQFIEVNGKMLMKKGVPVKTTISDVLRNPSVYGIDTQEAEDLTFAKDKIYNQGSVTFNVRSDTNNKVNSTVSTYNSGTTQIRAVAEFEDLGFDIQQYNLK